MRALFAVATPAAALLGREVVEVDPAAGFVRIRYAARPDFANRHGGVQGGLLSAMLDSATALALMVQLPPDLTAVTTRLETRFVAPAPLGPLVASARLMGRQDRDATSHGELADETGRIVATATADLRIVRRKG